MPVHSKHGAFSSSQLDASFNHISSREADMHLIMIYAQNGDVK